MPLDVPNKDDPDQCPLCSGWGVYSTTREICGVECLATVRCECPAGQVDGWPPANRMCEAEEETE